MRYISLCFTLEEKESHACISVSLVTVGKYLEKNRTFIGKQEKKQHNHNNECFIIFSNNYLSVFLVAESFYFEIEWESHRLALTYHPITAFFVEKKKLYHYYLPHKLHRMKW